MSSQIRYDVSMVGANGRTRVAVPPDDVTGATPITTAGGGTRLSSSSSLLLGVAQLPCSPLAPAKIFLTNKERCPIAFQIQLETRPPRHHGSRHRGQDTDGADDEPQTQQQQQQHDGVGAALLVHPIRGIVPPGGVCTIAALLPPPTRETGRGALSPASRRTPSPDASADRRRSATPRSKKSVSFAVRGSRTRVDSDSGGDDDQGGASAPQHVLVRIKLMSRIALETTLPPMPMPMPAVASPATSAMISGSDDGTDKDSSAASANQQRPFRGVWARGLELPIRTIEVVASRPRVTRTDYLEHMISRRVAGCDALAREEAALARRCELRAREARDVREACMLDRLASARSEQVVGVPLLVGALGVAAAFVAGFSL